MNSNLTETKSTPKSGLLNGAREVISSASDQIITNYQDARKTMNSAANEAQSFVRANPLTSVLASVGVGLVLGRILSMRFRSDRH
jgi:ElaB/YqjD/DUF883 family membrane-anchored ribosome-binding protein